jgi:hypothetical protein
LHDWRADLPIPAAAIMPATGVDIYFEIGANLESKNGS